MPRGKLEVVIAGGADLKFQNDSFNPVMEFRVGNQRVTVDEQINPMKAIWKDKRIKFDTFGLWEELEIRFFNDQEHRASSLGGSLEDTGKVSTLSLLGSF